MPYSVSTTDKVSMSSTHCNLTDAILNPATALQSTVEDFLESFGNNGSAALADLITCFLRCCGCNDTLNSDQIDDIDGIVDALDTITEELRRVRQVGQLIYYDLCVYLGGFASLPLEFQTSSLQIIP